MESSVVVLLAGDSGDGIQLLGGELGLGGGLERGGNSSNFRIDHHDKIAI